MSVYVCVTVCMFVVYLLMNVVVMMECYVFMGGGRLGVRCAYCVFGCMCIVYGRCGCMCMEGLCV